MWKVVVVTAVVAAAAGFTAGHFAWPVRQSTRHADTPRRGRWQPPPPADNDDGTATSAPEIWTADQVLQAVRDLAKLPSNTKRAEEAMAITQHIEPADAPLLAPKLAALPNDRVIITLFNSVLDMWAQVEPEKAFRFAAGLTRSGLRYQSMMSAMTAWVDTDLAAATAYVESQPRGTLGVDLIAAVLRGAAEHDPQRALALAKKISSADARDDARQVFDTWAQTDAAGAAKAASDIKDTRERIAAMESVIAAWSAQDPTAALDWVVEHNADPGHQIIVEQSFSAIAFERPDLAATYVAKLDDGSTRDSVIGTLAIRWANDDRDAAKRWALSLDGNDRTLALDGMATALSYDDPVTAFEMAKSIDDPSRRGRSLQGVLMTWADHDPDEAWKRAQDLEPGREKEEVVAMVIGSLARTNPIAAAEALAELEDSPANIRASTDVARAWTEIDPQSALRWVDRMPEGDSRDLAKSTIAQTWVTADPEAATAWAERNGSDAIKRDMAMNWAMTDPQSAAEWAMEHTKVPGEERNTTFEQTMSQWAANDSRRAAQWAQNLPRGRDRDSAYEQLSENTLYNDPETAMSYVDQIGDKKMRDATRARMFAAFKDNDAKKAERWRGSARLSPDELKAMDTPPEPEPEPEADGSGQGRCICPPPGAP